MGLTVVPENVLKRLSPETRAELGKAGVTAAEAQDIYDARAERELQNQMASLLRQRNLFFIRSRMDKRTTTRRGIPDFIIVLPGGAALAVEAKVQGGKISEHQKQVFDEYWAQTGTVVHIVFNLEQFRQLLDQRLPIAA